VTDPTAAARYEADDARLLNMVRAGDSEAFAVLRERHEVAARRLARHLVASPYEVDDVVAEAFAWVLDVTRRGGGPSNAVRPYLLTALRRVCYFRLTGQPTWQGVDASDRVLPEPGEPFVEPSMAGLETALIARAYLSLPERWRAVLWHAQIERARPADVAPLLGLTRNGVAALDRRAAEGLRQAYLQQHLTRINSPDCRRVAERLGGYVRDPHGTADAAVVAAHLNGCDACQAVYSELADVGGTLRAVVGPLVLGPAAAAYLFGPGDGEVSARASSGRVGAQPAAAGSQIATGGLIAGGAIAGGAIAGGAIAGGRAAATTILDVSRGLWRRPRPSRRVAALAGVAVVAAVVLAVTLIDLEGNGSTPTSARGPDHPAAATAPTTSPSVPS
jgi:DNA-directed RNA polymerase specialized sigma24 family protein